MDQHKDREQKTEHVNLKTEAQALEQSPKDDAWQKALLPFMKYMLIAFSIFFFISSVVQLFYLHNKIEFEIPESLTEVQKFTDTTIVGQQWQLVAELERHALLRRYHQANVSLMSSVWIKYLGFLTGMIVTLCGAVFILGKINMTESKFSAEGEFMGASGVSLKSSSPGLFLALFGVILMSFTANIKSTIDVKDGPAYIPVMFLDQGTQQKNNDKQEGSKALQNATRKENPDSLPL